MSILRTLFLLIFYLPYLSPWFACFLSYLLLFAFILLTFVLFVFVLRALLATAWFALLLEIFVSSQTNFVQYIISYHCKCVLLSWVYNQYSLIKDIKFLIISNSNQNALKQFLIYVDDKWVVGFFANEQAVAYFEFCILLRKFAL